MVFYSSMKVLAIETSCDETAVAAIEVTPQTKNKPEQIRVLSNVISSQIKLHAKYGGVVPNLAAREHVKNIKHVFESALKLAVENRKWKIENGSFPIDLIAVTHGPGLGPALIVGITFAKTLAWLHKIPLVGVNHMDGHIHSNWLRPIAMENKELRIKNKGSLTPHPSPLAPSPTFPALNLVVSGGHTELVLMKDHGKYKIIGETLDDAVGEAFDKAARLLGLPYPGGPAIARLALEGNPDAYPLPQPMLHSKNYDFSYSGLKTALLYLIRDIKKDFGLSTLDFRLSSDLAASFQKTAIEVLVAKTARALKEFKVKSLLLSGGVSANLYLRKRLQDIATEAGISFFCPAMEYTTDNAAMIAVAGYFQHLKANKIKTDYASVVMNPNITL